jgi:Putative restriction endonuclease
MSVALVEHTGPWTADDVEALPDQGDHARFEVYDGGVLVVSPAPGVAHQRASYWLHRALAEAATAAGADVEVLEAVNVALPGGKLLVPDVVVATADAAASATTRIPCEAVLAMVEVVSPSTVSMGPSDQAGHVRGGADPGLLASGVAGWPEGLRGLAEPRPVCHPYYAHRRNQGPRYPAIRC